ncbi:hypothetical protein FACS1894132_02980 [Clostridia bacterium]|nr:hypothetical protein FACS1894132_02980 [Clostridia bacterium]
MKAYLNSWNKILKYRIIIRNNVAISNKKFIIKVAYKTINRGSKIIEFFGKLCKHKDIS